MSTVVTNEGGSNSATSEGSRRTGAKILLVGALTMLAGAVAFAVSGVDLDASLASGTMAEYLVGAETGGTLVRANLGLWITGVILMGMGGVVLTQGDEAKGAASSVARFCFIAGPAAAIVFFSLWLAVVVELAPAHAAGAEVVTMAAALGQAATLADWIATALIVGLGAYALGASGRGSWAPVWLYRWGQICLAAAVVSLVALVFANRSPVMFLVVPIGLGFMIATGVVAGRHRG